MSLAKWARRDDVESASDELDSFPVVRDNGRVLHPFPVASEGYQGAYEQEDIREAIRSAPTREVALDSLHAIQESVWPQWVRNYFDAEAAPARGHRTAEQPVVLERAGVRYIYDGHHRLTAKKLLGRRSAEVKYVDLDALSPAKGPAEKNRH